MAWIKEITRKDGGITYRVSWREPGDAKESTLTIRDDKGRAELNVRLLNANGQSFTAVQRAVAQAKVGGISVREMIERHIDQLTDPAEGTINKYRKAVPLYFNGHIGNIPVQALTQQDVKAWIKEMIKRPSCRGGTISSKTISNQHGLLSAAMNTAVNTPGIKLKRNPCQGVKMPSDNRTEEVMRFMSAAEITAMADAISPARYRTFILFLLVTGMRFNEATALRPGDIRMEAGQWVARVERAWKNKGDGAYYIGKPKTKKSRRSVSLPPSMMALLQPLLDSSDPFQCVFRTSTGSPIRHSTFFKYWRRALDALNYPAGAGNRPRIHDIRHSHASIMLANGMNIYELSRRLGHESIQTTIDRYSHLSPDANFRSANIAEEAMSIKAAPMIEGETTAA
ncbi:tyrosine-type recombinase/integrase [Paeniglutamicibacter terrestris]|uniref:Site-specific integrase n=1 Tax=Paeniglutamicibacter terrestris TaxID=2723403 RepID=A0ABX1G6E0_9MICC|nr:site-specific integrase [Paeniglutamicibacter terrestris]NKG21131.1 site-specific integrase [Paeniglutamicibacter terrestris]